MAARPRVLGLTATVGGMSDALDTGKDLRDHPAARTPSWRSSSGRGRLAWCSIEHSPRTCSLEQAQRITTALRRKVELCGVFVNARMRGDRRA